MHQLTLDWSIDYVKKKKKLFPVREMVMFESSM